MPIDIPTLLNKNKNKVIQLKIRDNKTIKWVLQNFDIHMNSPSNYKGHCATFVIHYKGCSIFEKL